MSDMPKPTKRLARPKAKSSIDVNKKTLLEDIYRIIRRDVDHYSNLAAQALNETQARIVRDHGKYLLEAIREERIAEKEDRDKNRKLTDAELKQVLKQLTEGETT